MAAATFSFDDEPSSGTPESGDILENMPTPQQHAIDAAAATVDSEEPQSTDVDSDGNPWNPTIHATSAGGGGIKTGSGKWRKKRGAAKHTSVVAPRRAAEPASTGPTETAPPSNEAVLASCRAAGAAAATSVFAIGRALGGEDWQPTKEEVEFQSQAWGDYFIAKGVTDFPPGLALTIAVLGYAGPRLFTPKTKERAGVIKHWFSVRIAKWKVKRELKKRGILANVTIKGSTSPDVYDSILIDGKPFNEYPKNGRP